MARGLIAGNWKMNGLIQSLDEITQVAQTVGLATSPVDILICPPATLISAAASAAGDSQLSIGAQTCHAAEKGAHTGDLSSQMIKEAGATYVIVGHSERRADHGETDSMVAAQADAAIAAGLKPIICIGESREQREAGETETIILGQLRASTPQSASGANFAVAYEPIWAIGTGLVPEMSDIQTAHAALRACLKEMKGADAGGETPLLYGGSMKPGNAADILALDDVNGGLIGGASLKANDFLAIYSAAGKAL